MHNIEYGILTRRVPPPTRNEAELDAVDFVRSVGVETLAAGLSEPRDTVEEVIEPYLIQLGLIARTARGRCLNDGGWTHLGLAPPSRPQGDMFDE